MDSAKQEIENNRVIDDWETIAGHSTHLPISHRAPQEFKIISSTLRWFFALVFIAGLLTGAITHTLPSQPHGKPLTGAVLPGHPWQLNSPPTGHVGPPLLAQQPGPDMSFALVVLIKPKPIIAPVPAPTQQTHTSTTHNATSAPAIAVSATGRIQVVIAYALRQLGKPYVYGAAGPNSFDCSGLVLAAYAQIGIKMYHFTGAMLGYGSKVSRAAMQPGDLIFPSSGHVGIYLGNNKAVFAPHSGTVVQIQTISSFYTARHITTG